jgi:[CysO sulfur-carrier protein]-S-L-cysteine hydrolase
VSGTGGPESPAGGAGRIRIRSEVLAQILDEARRAPHEECCGLLGGSSGAITRAFPARNALASATAYEIAPEELFRIFREMRRLGLEHLGIYHSHPASENAPSPRDIEQAFYPDAGYFILSPLASAERPVRAFSIREGSVAELVVERV